MEVKMKDEKMNEECLVFIVNTMLIMSYIHGVGLFITWDMIPAAIDLLYHTGSDTSPSSRHIADKVLQIQIWFSMSFFVSAMYAVYLRLALYFRLALNFKLDTNDPDSCHFAFFFAINVTQFLGFLGLIVVYALHMKLGLFLCAGFILTSLAILLYYDFLIFCSAFSCSDLAKNNGELVIKCACFLISVKIIYVIVICVCMFLTV